MYNSCYLSWMLLSSLTCNCCNCLDNVSLGTELRRNAGGGVIRVRAGLHDIFGIVVIEVRSVCMDMGIDGL